MGKNSQLKAQRRNEKIERVQRERDIAEVFGADTAFDAITRYVSLAPKYPLRSRFPNSPDLRDSENPLFREVSFLKFDSDFNVIGNSVVCISIPRPEKFDRSFTFKSKTDFDGECIEYKIDWDMKIDEFGVPFDSIFFNIGRRIGCWFNLLDWTENFIYIDTHTYIMHEGIPHRLPAAFLSNEKAEWTIGVTVVEPGEDEPDEPGDAPEILIGILRTCMDTIKTLTYSNIELVDQPPNPRLSAISEREFGRPLTTYKVLKVNTGHKEYQGRDRDTGLQDFDPRRMHVVRGHHAEYGTNGRKLLFGKYERKIWIPAHVRGNEELGIVVKDYEVVAPTLG